MKMVESYQSNTLMPIKVVQKDFILKIPWFHMYFKDFNTKASFFVLMALWFRITNIITRINNI